MTKQEEIREGIKEWVLEIRQYLINTEFAPEPFANPVDPEVLTIKFPENIMKYLHSKDVVIRVDRELPENTCEQVLLSRLLNWDSVYKLAQQDMTKAGHEAVEPLIKDDK